MAGTATSTTRTRRTRRSTATNLFVKLGVQFLVVIDRQISCYLWLFYAFLRPCFGQDRGSNSMDNGTLGSSTFDSSCKLENDIFNFCKLCNNVNKAVPRLKFEDPNCVIRRYPKWRFTPSCTDAPWYHEDVQLSASLALTSFQSRISWDTSSKQPGPKDPCLRAVASQKAHESTESNDILQLIATCHSGFCSKFHLFLAIARQLYTS